MKSGSKKQRSATASDCACGSGANAQSCCLPFIEGTDSAPSVQALMRSRFTAYAIGNTDYLLRTWHPSTRPTQLQLDARVQWLGLKLKKVEAGQPGDREGTVEFIARFKYGSRGQRIHENSRFVFVNDGWLYVDGESKHQPNLDPLTR